MTSPVIYGLVDPRDHLVHYVGKSINGLDRAFAHYYEAHRQVDGTRRRNRENAKCRWIRELEHEGLRYEIVALDTAIGVSCWWRVALNPTPINDLECWWIAYGHACGWPLTNGTNGGEYGAQRSTESRQQQGAALRARWSDPAYREKMKSAHASRRNPYEDPNERERHRVIMREVANRPSVKAQLRERLLSDRNPSKTPEARAKIGASSRGRKWTPEQREKIRTRRAG